LKAESLAKTMASPFFACLHTKRITVVISIGEKCKGENYVSKYEQLTGIACFTAMEGIKREGTSLKAGLSYYLSKQGSETTYEEIEKYVYRWDIENI